jgi:hypothetical protein
LGWTQHCLTLAFSVLFRFTYSNHASLVNYVRYRSTYFYERIDQTSRRRVSSVCFYCFFTQVAIFKRLCFNKRTTHFQGEFARCGPKQLISKCIVFVVSSFSSLGFFFSSLITDVVSIVVRFRFSLQFRCVTAHCILRATILSKLSVSSWHSGSESQPLNFTYLEKSRKEIHLASTFNMPIKVLLYYFRKCIIV